MNTFTGPYVFSVYMFHIICFVMTIALNDRHINILKIELVE